jgi:hypothetical protein
MKASTFALCTPAHVRKQVIKMSFMDKPLDNAARALTNLASEYEKAWRIGEFHANSNKPIMSREQFSDTYYTAEDFLQISVEFGLTRKEMHDVYAKGYRHAINARVQANA